MRKIFLLTLGFLSCFHLQSQSKLKIDKSHYKITYLLSYKPDSTDAQLILKENMFLFIGKDKSKFISEGFYARDSVAKNMKEDLGANIDVGSIFKSIPKSKFKDVIYKNYPIDKISVSDAFGGNYYLYEEDKDLFNWKIHPQYNVINGYNCQKATTEFSGRQFIAWFAKEIPINDGPYKFNGLPGLILSVYDIENNYNFKLDSIEKIDFDMLFDKKNYIKTTKLKLFEYKRKFYENFVESAAQNGLTLELDPVQKRALNEKLSKRNNNSIEIVF